jgi:hypothetical protein
MDPKRIDEFRRKLREGHPVRVVNGKVVLPGRPAGERRDRDDRTRAASDGGEEYIPEGVQVKPHEWGAGETAPIYESAAGQKRALQEQALLSKEYPGFVMDVDSDGTLYTHGWIGANDVLRQKYHVLVLIPPGYGRGALPIGHVLEPRLRAGAPHTFRDGSLCLDHSGAFTSKSTLITFLAWVTVWLVLYEDWCETNIAW